MAFLGKLPIGLGAFFAKRFIVGGPVRVVGHYLRGTQCVTVFHAACWIVGALHELPSCRSNSVLVLFLGTLTQPRPSSSEISLPLPSLDRVVRVSDLFLLSVYSLSIVHIAVIIQLGPCYNGIGTSRPILIVHLSYLVRRCYVWQFNKIFKESLMVLALIAYPSKLFGVTHFRNFLSWVAARRSWIKQNTICIREKLLVAIYNIVASSEPLFFHRDLQIIWDCFGVVLTLT